MKDLKFNEFLNRADDFIINVAMGGEPYRIKAQAGNAILISEEQYQKYIVLGHCCNRKEGGEHNEQ